MGKGETDFHPERELPLLLENLDWKTQAEDYSEIEGDGVRRRRWEGNGTNV